MPSTVLEVSGDGVDGASFGTDRDDAMATLTGLLGRPSVAVGPTRYSPIEGEDGFYEVADDPISPSWQYPVASVSCWADFCAIFGGDTADALSLRGWELGVYNRWDTTSTTGDADRPAVRLAGTGITLGDTWESLREAYPAVVPGGAEGGSLGISDLPWSAIFDGAGEWRLSGSWDPAHPSKVPDTSVVTRLSGGEGPEPGCC